jgi:hypothetical protein
LCKVHNRCESVADYITRIHYSVTNRGFWVHDLNPKPIFLQLALTLPRSALNNTTIITGIDIDVAPTDLLPQHKLPGFFLFPLFFNVFEIAPMTSLARFMLTLCCLGGTIGCGQRVFENRQNAGAVLGRIPLIQKEAQSVGRVWRPDLAILPFAEFHDNEITIRHVRNCRYRTEEDYDVRHYDLRFSLNDVASVDFIVVPFKETTLLAHTMLSFGLRSGQHFCISVEARLDQGESYSAIGGLRKKFELIYVIADERDVIPLRTNTRDVEVYLFRGNASPEQAQNLLVDMLARSNKLQRDPEFYELITNNCTTNLVAHVNQLRPRQGPV